MREEGYAYIDKTDQVWYMDKYNYLSRPRRFGQLSQTNTWNLSRQTSEK